MVRPQMVIFIVLSPGRLDEWLKCRRSRGHRLQDVIHFPRAQFVRVVPQRSLTHGRTDRLRLLRASLPQTANDFACAVRHQYFTPGFKEMLDPEPGVCDEATCSSGRLEDTRWR